MHMMGTDQSCWAIPNSTRELANMVTGREYRPTKVAHLQLSMNRIVLQQVD